MEIKLTEKDVGYLIKILEADHEERNYIKLKECGFRNCWHKKFIKRLRETLPANKKESGK